MSCLGHSLPELIDLALQPNGVVNYKIIRKILHLVIKETNLENVRSECHEEKCYFTQTESRREDFEGKSKT